MALQHSGIDIIVGIEKGICKVFRFNKNKTYYPQGVHD